MEVAASDFYKTGDGFMEEGNFKLRCVAFYQLNEARNTKGRRKYRGTSDITKFLK